MTQNNLKLVGNVAKAGLLRQASNRIRTCHWMWLVVGIGIGWPMDAVRTAVFAVFNLIPVLGPLVIDLILGPIDAAIVAVLPITCVFEILRRCGIIGDDEAKK